MHNLSFGVLPRHKTRGLLKLSSTTCVPSQRWIAPTRSMSLILSWSRRHFRVTPFDSRPHRSPSLKNTPSPTNYLQSSPLSSTMSEGSPPALFVPDILDHIALHAVQSTFLGPPSILCSLLLVSQAFNKNLGYHQNPNLYARIFEFKFDTGAPLRRYGRERLTSTNLSTELRNRCAMMSHMRTAVQTGDVRLWDEDVVGRDLWTAYMMCIESDGKNLRQLLEYAGLHKYARLYVSKEVVHSKSDPKYPIETAERSLALWLMWFTTSIRMSTSVISCRTIRLI